MRFITAVLFVFAFGAFANAAEASRYVGGCNSRECLKRVQVHNAGYPFCNTWKCIERVNEKRARRQPWSVAVASWYGPGLYGNSTACGQSLGVGTYGVAHKSLPCGTKLLMCVSRCAIVPVIDRGPYVGGRSFDLTGPAKAAIGAGSISTVKYKILRR